MAQLVLFDSTDGGGPDEFVVIDDDDLTKEQLEKEYLAKVIKVLALYPGDTDSFPTNRSLVAE